MVSIFAILNGACLIVFVVGKKLLFPPKKFLHFSFIFLWTLGVCFSLNASKYFGGMCFTGCLFVVRTTMKMMKMTMMTMKLPWWVERARWGSEGKGRWGWDHKVWMRKDEWGSLLADRGVWESLDSMGITYICGQWVSISRWWEWGTQGVVREDIIVGMTTTWEDWTHDS